jgi:mRNA-degrading endonuclease RelE of RelBE toxin-antitoxin system
MTRFAITYAPEVLNHLAPIDRKFHGLIRETIVQQLQHTPFTQTKNRKPLDLPAPFGATWEIRFGPDNRFRVFYEILREKREVHVLAIGIKEGNRLVVGREEIEL